MTPTLPVAFQWVDDPLEGRLLFVGGRAPWVMRVVDTKGLTDWRYEDVRVEHILFSGTLVPDIVPPILRRYTAAAVLRPADLQPVDVLRIAYGSFTDGGARVFEWTGTVLRAVTAIQVRALLADADWLTRRGLGRARPTRAIKLED